MDSQPQILRDVVRRLLAERPGTTAGELAAQVHTGGSGRSQVQKALRQLESAGLARRQRGRGNQPLGGRAPDRWSPA